MKRIILAPVFFVSLILGACTLEIQSSSPQKNIEPAIMYSYTGEDGTQKVINQKTEYYDPAGFVVRNVEYCNVGHRGWYGFYDWVDRNADYTIKEAGCFDPKNGTLDESSQTLFGILSDDWGTYYGDKNGGAYNVIRISTATGAETLTFTASGYGDIPMIYAGGEYFAYGFKLEGLNNISELRVLDNVTWPSVFFITDGKSIWSYKSKVYGDPETFRNIQEEIYRDKDSCFILLPITGIKQLENCNPDTFRKLNDINSEQIINEVYTDGTNKYDSEGNIINQENFSESDITTIISELDAYAGQSIHTWIITDGNYSVTYVPSHDHTTDKFIIEIDWAKKYIDLPYNAQNKMILDDSSYGDPEIFLWFKSFSPDKKYIDFTVFVWWYWSKKWYVMDMSTWSIELKIENIITTMWSSDKKYYVYSSEFSWISIVKVWAFSQSINIWWDFSFPKLTLDDSYIYGIWCANTDCDPKMLKVYAINSWVQIFSQKLLK